MIASDPMQEPRHVALPPLKAVVAVCDDWGIGYQGHLLVENRADMRHFVDLTRDATVIMGRATLDSFPGGTPLKRRRNIVFSRDAGFARDGVEVVHGLEELARILDGDSRPAWVIGGQSIYELLLPHCCEAQVTVNHTVLPADSFFPALDALPDWHLAETYGQGQTEAGVGYEFRCYRRRD